MEKANKTNKERIIGKTSLNSFEFTWKNLTEKEHKTLESKNNQEKAETESSESKATSKEETREEKELEEEKIVLTDIHKYIESKPKSEPRNSNLSTSGNGRETIGSSQESKDVLEQAGKEGVQISKKKKPIRTN